MITGLELVQKLYSEGYYIEEQKEFNIIQELYHSGRKRVAKKYIGRLKRSLSDLARKESRNQIIKQKKALIKKENLDKLENKPLGIKLAKDANRLGDARVFDNNNLNRVISKGGENNYAINVNNSDKRSSSIVKHSIKMDGGYDNLVESFNGDRESARNLLKVADSLETKRNIINLKKGYEKDIPALAHEVGHTMNNTGAAGKKKQIINRLSKINKLKEENGTFNSNSGTKDRINENLKRNKILIKEEKNAWENGLDLMKKNGASNKEIRQAKKQRDISLDTYKAHRNSSLLEDIHKYLEPKGDRNIPVKPLDHITEKKKVIEGIKEKAPQLSDKVVDDFVENNYKTDRQVINLKRKRYAKRKDKNIFEQIFGNSRKRK